MFCIPLHDHHNHRRILHSFRSHKSLRAEAPATQEMHHRQPSEASSLARSSTDSLRPSTSRTDISIEWDPLRLHPVGPAPVLPVLDDARRHELRQARSLHGIHQHHLRRSTPHSHSHSQSGPDMVIYEGFDFGFGPNQTSQSAPTSPTTSEGPTPRPHPATDGPEYFKRGDWKRRGIVFGTSETAMATEAECFDLDVDM